MVTRLFKKVGTKVGTSPGTLVHVGEQRVDQVSFEVINYDDTTIEGYETISLEEALAHCDGARTTWLNVEGLHDTNIVARIGERFKIHPLTQEDILHTAQRPKKEEFENYLYIVLQMLRYLPDEAEVVAEQVSLILTPATLISFQESPGDVFAPVRERLQKNRGKIRSSGSDYLAYALVDAVVDHYFVILEYIGTQIEDLEEETIDNPKADVLHHIHELKREVISLRKQIWPLREIVVGLIKQDSPLIKTNTTLFFRDVYDHTIQIMDTIESYRDLLSGLLDLYLSNLSIRMNQVMKVLTIIATIFIPITFIAGVYGMNFEHMPELKWRYGYLMAWGIMIAMVSGLILLFKKKDWL
ncbi:MAG: magnesium/cobalt transporter CorA [Desulfobacteraceae bacterium]|nr:magnesium/cobalt transporter CorA [Desulfobacteraceae bacterium]